MPRIFCIIFFAFALSSSKAQYRNDNVAFKTIFPADLCSELEKHPGYLLLDVRSEGEFRDTSSSNALNIGHLNGAVNMDIRQLSSRLQEIAAYRQKPVFVYCSHSQRSRRVSKMLADSGFTQVNNINGGLTGIYQLDAMQRSCLEAMLRSTNGYTVLSPADVCKKLSGGDAYLLDVRADSVWNHTGANAKLNALGYLKGAHHISMSSLASRIGEVPRDREIIVTDLFGGEAASAAGLLKKNGYTKVYTLLEGIDRWNNSDKLNNQCNALYVSPVKFNIVNAIALSRYGSAARNMIWLDVRPVEEFSNKSQQVFRNIGHVQNAVNIPAAQLADRLEEMKASSMRNIIVYDFSGGTDAYAAAKTLADHGFTNVSVLAGGLFNLRWTASNIKDMSFMHGWVVDVPDENK